MTSGYFGPQLNAFIATIQCYGLQNSIATITWNKKHITYLGIRKQEDFQKLVILIVESSQTSENVRGSQWVDNGPKLHFWYFRKFHYTCNKIQHQQFVGAHKTTQAK